MPEIPKGYKQTEVGVIPKEWEVVPASTIGVFKGGNGFPNLSDNDWLWGGEPETTNNRMEMMAVIRALGALKRPVAVRVHTDSQYVQKGISEWIHGWKARGWKTASKEPVKNADLWRALDEAQARHQVKWLWVKGHAGHVENERADALARRGVDEVRKTGATVEP